jgi:hypothetical protein
MVEGGQLPLAETIPDPWLVAEDYMRRGFLPPRWVCLRLLDGLPKKFTRRHKWVIAGSRETLRHTLLADAEIRRQLIELEHKAMEEKKK